MSDITRYLKAAIQMPLFIVIVGCSPAIQNVAGVQEVRLSDVALCERRGQVRGIPGLYGPLKNIGLKEARKRALEAAIDLGANRVVFDPVGDEVVVTSVTGDAYFCPALSGT